METTRLDYLALMATRRRTLGLALAPQARWQDLYGMRMLRLEFPSAALAPSSIAHQAALALSSTFYGQEATPSPARWTFGPTARHAIDRVATETPATAPLLRFQRMLPLDDTAPAHPRPVTIGVFRAELAGEPVCDPQVTAGVVWLPLVALRLLVRGLTVDDALRLEGVTARLATGVSLPGDGFLYLPSDFGERLLLRVAAKYGETVLFE